MAAEDETASCSQSFSRSSDGRAGERVGSNTQGHVPHRRESHNACVRFGTNLGILRKLSSMLGQQIVCGCASIDIDHVSCRYNASLFECHGVPDLCIRYTVEWHETTPPGIWKHLGYLHFNCRRCTLIFHCGDSALAGRQ